MKLTSITALNFKGHAFFTEQLTSINFLIGANFAGKTARTDAIRLLLLGYLPELGKPAKETFALASGPVMEVSGTFDNGMTIRRRWTAKGNSIKLEEEIPAEMGKLGDLAVMLNAEVYFALGDRGRIDYVAKLVDLGSTYTTAGIVDRLMEKLALENLTPPDGKPLNIPLLACEQPTAQATIEEMLKATTQTYKDAKALHTRMEQTAQGLATLRAQDAQHRPASAIAAELTAARGGLANLQEEKGRIAAAYQTMLNARTQRAQITAEILKGDKASAQIETIREKRKAAHQAALAALPTPMIDPQPLRDTIRDHVRGQATAAANLKTVQTTIEHLQTEKTQLEHQQTCPFCGTAGETWRPAKIQQIEIQLVEARRLLKDHQLAHDKHADASAAAGRELARVENEAKEYAAAKEAADTLDRLLATYEPQIQRAAELRTQLAGLTPEDPKLQTAMEMTQTQINLKNQDIRKLEQEQQAAAGRATEIQRLAQCETQRDEAAIEMERIETVGKELKEIQSEMVAAAFRPILEHANSMFAGILKTPIAYHKEEVGTFRDGIWVAHHTFSGTEKALTYAAIQAALTQQSPCKLMLLDELGRLDDANCSLLIVRMLRLIEEGKIDTFIGIDTGRAGLYRVSAETDGTDHITVKYVE